MSDEATIIGIIWKNNIEEVHVSLSQYRGVNCIDVRIFADFTGDDEKRATKRGVSLKVERLPELIEALRNAEAEAGRRGLLGDGGE